MENVLQVLDYLIKNGQGILELIAGLYVLLKGIEAYKEGSKLMSKKDKLKALMDIVPHVVRVVDDMVDLFGDEKEKAFMDKVEKAAKSIGLDLTEEELEGLKIIGSGIHKENQDWERNYGNLKIGKKAEDE